MEFNLVSYSIDDFEKLSVVCETSNVAVFDDVSDVFHVNNKKNNGHDTVLSERVLIREWMKDL